MSADELLLQITSLYKLCKEHASHCEGAACGISVSMVRVVAEGLFAQMPSLTDEDLSKRRVAKLAIIMWPI